MSGSATRVRTAGWLSVALFACAAAALLVNAEPAIALVGAGLVLLVGVGITAGATGTAVALLAAYLVPLFAFGRSFARIGVAPLQLPEVLLVAALVVSLPRWWPAYKSEVPRWFKVTTLLFAALAGVSVARGLMQGYPGALRGLPLVVYPALSAPVAAWIATYRRHWDRILTVAVAAAPLGVLTLSAVAPSSIVAAAYGLYLSGLVGVAMTTDNRATRLLLIACGVAGSVGLAATGRRGPLLALTVAFAVCIVALTGYRPRHVLKVVTAVLLAVVLVSGAVVLGAVRSSDLPGVAAVTERTRRGLEPGSPEEANVAFRLSVWANALSTVKDTNPLLGTGFGRPFDLRFRTRDLAKEETTGAHNSYVGVTYAAGFPAGVLFIGIIVATARSCLRRPRWDRRRPLQLAWLASAALIAFTNVAAETTYIGGPLWLILGWLSLPSELRPASPAPAVVDGPAFRSEPCGTPAPAYA